MDGISSLLDCLAAAAGVPIPRFRDVLRVGVAMMTPIREMGEELGVEVRLGRDGVDGAEVPADVGAGAGWSTLSPESSLFKDMMRLQVIDSVHFLYIKSRDAIK